MKTMLPEKISTIEEAKSFLTVLFNNGEGFHPEDDATEVVWTMPDAEQPSADEKEQLNKLMDNIYFLDDFDPCAFIMDEMSKGKFDN